MAYLKLKTCLPRLYNKSKIRRSYAYPDLGEHEMKKLYDPINSIFFSTSECCRS